MSKALDYLGIARMSGNIQLGEENASSAVKFGKAKLLLVASDTSEGARKRAEGYVFGRSAPIVTVPFTKQEISAATGKAGCSMAAITDIGLAERFASALEEEYGGDFAPLAQSLSAKLEKAKKRRGTGKKSSGNRRKSV